MSLMNDFEITPYVVSVIGSIVGGALFYGPIAGQMFVNAAFPVKQEREKAMKDENAMKNGIAASIFGWVVAIFLLDRLCASVNAKGFGMWPVALAVNVVSIAMSLPHNFFAAKSEMLLILHSTWHLLWSVVGVPVVYGYLGSADSSAWEIVGVEHLEVSSYVANWQHTLGVVFAALFVMVSGAMWYGPYLFVKPWFAAEFPELDMEKTMKNPPKRFLKYGQLGMIASAVGAFIIAFSLDKIFLLTNPTTFQQRIGYLWILFWIDVGMDAPHQFFEHRNVYVFIIRHAWHFTYLTVLAIIFHYI